MWPPPWSLTNSQRAYLPLMLRSPTYSSPGLNRSLDIQTLHSFHHNGVLWVPSFRLCVIWPSNAACIIWQSEGWGEGIRNPFIMFISDCMKIAVDMYTLSTAFVFFLPFCQCAVPYFHLSNSIFTLSSIFLSIWQMCNVAKQIMGSHFSIPDRIRLEKPQNAVLFFVAVWLKHDLT